MRRNIGLTAALSIFLPHLAGCATETLEMTQGDYRLARGRVTFGQDRKEEWELPTPLGMAKSKSEERGAPESLQAVSDDVTTTISVVTGFITITRAVTAFTDGLFGSVNAAKSAGVQKAAIGAGAKEIPKRKPAALIGGRRAVRLGNGRWVRG